MEEFAALNVLQILESDPSINLKSYGVKKDNSNFINATGPNKIYEILFLSISKILWSTIGIFHHYDFLFL